MPELEKQAEFANRADARATRVDPAHRPRGESAVLPPAEEMSAMAGLNEVACAKQIERQSDEIKLHMQVQQDELDEREAQLNAQLANLENELRTTRLRTQLAKSYGQSDSPGHDAWPVRDAGNTASSTEDDMLPTAAETSQGSVPLARSNPNEGSGGDIRNQHEVAGTQRHQNHAQAQIDRDREVLRQRKRQLDRRAETVQKMHDQTLSLRREALEMRLATFQLLAELGAEIPAHVIEQSIAGLRAKLSQHYQEQDERLSRSRSELNGLRDRLAKKQQRIRQQSHAFRRWIDERHREIERKAKRLVARETELEARARELGLPSDGSSYS